MQSVARFADVYKEFVKEVNNVAVVGKASEKNLEINAKLNGLMEVCSCVCVCVYVMRSVYVCVCML